LAKAGHPERSDRVSPKALAVAQGSAPVLKTYTKKDGEKIIVFFIISLYPKPSHSKYKCNLYFQ